MHPGNLWGGTLDAADGDRAATAAEEELRLREAAEWDRGAIHSQRLMGESQRYLDETQQSWLLSPQETLRNKKKKKHVNLGCVSVSRKAFLWTVGSIAVAFVVVGLPIIVAKSLPRHKSAPPPPDNYTLALHKALLFFNAQKSGKLPKNNGISWRGDSGLNDGSAEVAGGLVGGYYDGGTNVKFHFPMAFSMTMLSWSLIEYSHKFKAIKEYDHARDLLKWGTDYLLLTFNNSAVQLDKIYIQVGGGTRDSRTPDDIYCWQKPEDMSYARPVLSSDAATDLAAEMAAALAAASIVFQDKPAYSKKLVKGAETLWPFARSRSRRRSYSRGQPVIEEFYNSTSIYDEFMWGGAWLYYATGNTNYIQVATDPRLPTTARAFSGRPDLFVPSWNNKLPASMLLMTRYRMFLSPGYPYEDMLRMYHNMTGVTMCSYLKQYNVFNWTRGGLIELNMGRPRPLEYVAHASFLASLFADYMNATGVPGWYCGPTFISNVVLKQFATSQVDYILGKNPLNMSFVVGFGSKFPRHVHHRGATIPSDRKRRSCSEGWQWRDTKNPNPNNIVGAMVGGPNSFDQFHDLRHNYNASEPTLAGNSGLVAALVSLTNSESHGIDKNTIFNAVPPLYPKTPPPPQPWKP
ncbi:PREDICTED: endoglucanase 7 [Tarenaya hassleriana]|uniref:endoglucanase 7 n=1 Tax=Tarenaya hassleriana TaxID=28532 RepID=UPI00053C4F67|nr:PREDICTED: endoglucanase 7 [Tarenaya hassleriana]